MPILTARCRPSKDAGALGSSWINEHYTASQRHEDHKGLPEVAHPQKAAIRKPYRDPNTFPVLNETGGEILALRRRLKFLASFKQLAAERQRLDRHEVEPVVPRYAAFLEPLPEAKEAWSKDAKAERDKHDAWLAKEKADNDARRLLRALRS